MAVAARDLTGMRFGRLLVIERSAGRYKASSPWWFCVCDCGKGHESLSNYLRKGVARSCGCLRRDMTAARFKKHGQSHDRLYIRWTMMKQRCSNAKRHNYACYGGRGVSVCARWQSFDAFRDDMGEAFHAHVAAHGERDTTLDRVNSDGDYEPANCRWATMPQQLANRRWRRQKERV